MAFCNSCGASLDPGVKFCNKCGKPIASTPASPVVVSASSPAGGTGGAVAPAAQSSSALKIILIIVAVIVVIGILGVATIGFIGWRIAKSSHVRQEGNSVKVETPFGSLDSSANPEDVVRNLNVDIYPGAKIQKDGTASASIFGMKSVTANLRTNDSVDQVATFYKAKFPNAMVSSSDTNHCTIVSTDKQNMITINVQAEGDYTQITIANVTRKSSSGNSSSN